MNEAQRETIHATAKYLRNIRPIDPAEIQDYIEGSLHPAVIRQVLREDAVDLGLIETPDGTFVPPPDEPIGPRDTVVSSFPPAATSRLEAILVEDYGPDWFTGDTGDHLRDVIRQLKAKYLHGEPIEYTFEEALGYAIYHLPGYYASIQYVLDDLTDNRLLDRTLRIIDVGAGVGGPALGLAEYLPANALIDYHAIEPSAAADILESVLAETPRNFHWAIHRTRAETADLVPADLVVFANVLSELASPVATVTRYANALTDTGSLILLAPADKETSIHLRTVERALVPDFTVYSPTVRIWEGDEPTDRCWSFDVKPDLEPPPFQRRLDEAGGNTGEFVNVDVQFAYAILRADGQRRFDVAPNTSRFAKLASTRDHVTKRIDIVACKLSHDLSDNENPIFLIGDGSQRIDHFAVLTRPTSLNRALIEADYGDLLRFERALVLWNDDEAAVNLVIDEETIVDRIAP